MVVRALCNTSFFDSRTSSRWTLVQNAAYLEENHYKSSVCGVADFATHVWHGHKKELLHEVFLAVFTFLTPKGASYEVTCHVDTTGRRAKRNHGKG